MNVPRYQFHGASMANDVKWINARDVARCATMKEGATRRPFEKDENKISVIRETHRHIENVAGLNNVSWYSINPGQDVHLCYEQQDSKITRCEQLVTAYRSEAN